MEAITEKAAMQDRKRPLSEQAREACERAAALSGESVEELIAYYAQRSPDYADALRRVLMGEADHETGFAAQEGFSKS